VEVCAQAGSRFEALRELERVQPELAIVDVSLGDSPQGGLDLVRDMKQLRQTLKILVFSMHEECIYAERALSAGASGYLMKKENSTKVIEALDWVIKGNIYVSQKVSQKILLGSAGRARQQGASPASASTEKLSNREFEILNALSTGRTAQAIAKELGISVKTLDVHKANIKRKLLLKSASDLNEFSINYFRPPTL
jgi:DNA-binding NarL/FixJ family response regulator